MKTKPAQHSVARPAAPRKKTAPKVEPTQQSVVVPVPKVSGRGGARPGAGRKPLGYVPRPEKVDYDIEKALHEKSKRERSELAYKKESREVVSRVAVQEACATALAMAAQSLRSMPDNLERKLSLAPAVTEEIEKTIHAVLTDLAAAFAALHSAEEPA